MSESIEEIPNPIPLELPMGASEIEYPELPKDVHVLEVTLKGMRAREIKLVRVRPSSLNRYHPSLRGLPAMYALDFKKRTIRFFPAALGSYTVFLHHGAPGLAEDEPSAVA